MTTILTTTRNRYDDGDTVQVRFVTRWGYVREGWISRSDREGSWYFGVAAGVLSNASPEAKAAEQARVDALPGPFAPGDLVLVDGRHLEVPAEVARYGSGPMHPPVAPDAHLDDLEA